MTETERVIHREVRPAWLYVVYLGTFDTGDYYIKIGRTRTRSLEDYLWQRYGIINPFAQVLWQMWVQDGRREAELVALLARKSLPENRNGAEYARLSPVEAAQFLVDLTNTVYLYKHNDGTPRELEGKPIIDPHKKVDFTLSADPPEGEEDF